METKKLRCNHEVKVRLDSFEDGESFVLPGHFDLTFAFPGSIVEC